MGAFVAPFFMASILPGYAADQLLDPSALVDFPKKSTVSGHTGDYYFGDTDPWVVVVKSVETTTTTKTRSTK